MDTSGIWLQHLVREFEKRTGDPDMVNEVLGLAGLTRDMVHSSDPGGRMLQEAQFVRQACEKLKDPAFAAEAGLSFDTSSTIVGYIVKYSENLQSAIENATTYNCLVDQTIRYSLKVSGNSASFETESVDPGFAKFHRRQEYLIFCAISRMRAITGSHFFPIEIRFCHDLKTSNDKITRLAGCPVIFGAEKTEILLPLSSLDLPVPTYDANLRKLLTEYGDTLLKKQPKPNATLRSKIEGILLKGIPGRIASKEDVAVGLGMSTRTLARRLNEQDLSYRDIVDGIRRDLSHTYLKGGFTISEVAFYLDYADQAAFSTAFKRWTNTTPRSFQLSHA